ncbi:hypothetical protein DPMN_138224 [Dreissena polymorpha]|uniref:C1q domain-containing protein n=1 Tax=Dreissena polymorpha TaxID=45954 RepID=A0A9D4G3E2_DREPO|nr:hypothetical protein DPMN_138224 [Dreissena polymorpha]
MNVPFLCWFLSDQLTIPFIYFHANSPADYSLDSGQDVIFTNVRVNEGQGYDTKTGIFTVSVPGLYVFTVQYYVGSSTSAGLAIAHRGIQIQANFMQLASGNYVTSSTQVFVRAAMSDQIWVEII